MLPTISFKDMYSPVTTVIHFGAKNNVWMFRDKVKYLLCNILRKHLRKIPFNSWIGIRPRSATMKYMISETYFQLDSTLIVHT